MYYTYVLESLKDHKRYIGSTSDLKRRLDLHNAGLVPSTKYRIPFKLLFFEEFETQSEARWRERSFKRSHDLLNRAMLRANGRPPAQRASGQEGAVG